MTRQLSFVRNAARQERGRLEPSPASLVEALRQWLIDTYEIEPVPTDGVNFLQGSRGEVVPAEGCLYYDQKLEANPQELLEVFAHELAHLVLHHRQFGARTQDLIRGSTFHGFGVILLQTLGHHVGLDVDFSILDDISQEELLPVSLARANNDASERDGIVRTVQSWLDDGFQTEDIAVLARRNIDVRNIAIALKRQGIRAVTSGLLTAEGAGGDLAAVLAAVDHHQAIARVAYALYRRLLAPEILNDAVSQLLACDREAEIEPVWTGLPETRLAAHGLWQSSSQLRRLLHSGDAWTVLCESLFFGAPLVLELCPSAMRPDP